MRSILFTPSAARQWAKLTKSTRSRLDIKLSEFAERGVGDVKRLKGRAGSRLRAGDWRIIFDEQDDAIIVVAVGHRREIHD